MNGRLVFSPFDFSDPKTIEITPPPSRSPSPYVPKMRTNNDAAFPINSLHSFIPPKIATKVINRNLLDRQVTRASQVLNSVKTSHSKAARGSTHLAHPGFTRKMRRYMWKTRCHRRERQIVKTAVSMRHQWFCRFLAFANPIRQKTAALI